MNKFQPIQYIKKYAIVVIAFFILLTAGLFFLLKKMQTYTATVVINYAYQGAENGLSPDGSQLDVTGIYSSSVIKQVLDNLGLDQGKYPIDSIRSAITVTQIQDDEVTAINTALNEDGEYSGLQSTRYEVSYKVKASEGEEFARTMLDEILDVYFTRFSGQYVNKSTATNSTSDINLTGYEYIEQVELIDDALERTIASLNGQAGASPGFYSTDSGVSFHELVDSFHLLRITQIPDLFSYILKHQVAKDKDVLLSKYAQRVQAYEFDKTENSVRVDEVEGILDAYVEKLRASNNTADSEVINGNTYKGGNVLGDVESPNYTDSDGQTVAYDQTTEYEQLLQNWIDSMDIYNKSVIEAGYCQYVINCFAGNDSEVTAYQEATSDVESFRRRAKTSDNATEEGAGDEQGDEMGEAAGNETAEDTAEVSDAARNRLEGPAEAQGISDQIESGIYAEPTAVCTEQDIAYVEERLDSMLRQMDALYETVKITDEEYNEYLGAQYIKMISSNNVTERLNVTLYTIVGAVLFLVIGCFGVILLGRIGDMVEYVAYTDHQYRLPNRVACDRYIQDHREKVLPAGFGCLFLQVTNQNEINRKFGRENGDQALIYFASSLRSMFYGQGDFVGYNGGSQFMAFTQNTNVQELKKRAGDFEILLQEHFKEQKMSLEYTVGIAESADENMFSIRSLISSAVQKKKTCRVGDRKDINEGEE